MVDWNVSIKKPFLDIKNLLIGIVLSILPIISWFATGYALECSGLTKKKISLDKSPEWSDWGNLFVRGLLATVISIIYFLPALLLFITGAFSALAVVFSHINWSDLFNGNSAAVSQTLSQNWTVIAPAIIAALPFIFLAVILALFAYYVIPAALMNFLNYNNFGKAFSLGEIFRKAFTSKYFVAWLLVLVIMVVISAVLSWIPYVGPAAASFIISVISYTVYGQVYREIKKA